MSGSSIDPFSTTSTSVIVLTKHPTPGRVKTRLMPALGAEGSAELHVLLVRATLERALASGLPVGVSLGGLQTGPFVRMIASLGVPVEAQVGGDLGDRLRHALRGPGRRVALGTDCPVFDPAWLREAAEAPTPLCFGPSDDGGYWTVALDPPQDPVFTDIPWSTERTLSVSLERAAAAGVDVSMLPACYDVDEPPGLERLREDPRCPEAVRRFLVERLPGR